MGVGNPAPTGGRRGDVLGWSAAAVRRHKRWLYSVEAPGLSGEGDAVTLTLRDCPASHEEWQRILASLFQSLRRAGLLRWHWVVEWQRRGVPHVHLAVYGRRPPGQAVVSLWLRLTGERYGAWRCAQYVTPITGPVGWLKYLSKHASRGVAHYQRQSRPEGWEKSGRLWGYGGSWPVLAPVAGVLERGEFWRLRRMIRRYVIAEARGRGDWRGVSYLRRMLACHDRALSEVRGVSEWVPVGVGVAMAECAGWDGELLTESDTS